MTRACCCEDGVAVAVAGVVEAVEAVEEEVALTVADADEPLVLLFSPCAAAMSLVQTQI